MARKKQTNNESKQSTPSNGTEPPDIPFEAAVSECKEIRARIEGRNEDTERDHFRIGEIADKVETVHGDRTLAKLAARSGYAYSCMKRYLSVYRAWKGTPFGAPGPQTVSVAYSVLRELAALDDREQILRARPNLTKREAERLRRARSGGANGNGNGNGKDNDKGRGNGKSTDKNRTWLNKLSARNNDISADAETRHQELTAEQLAGLIKALAAAPSLPEQKRQAAEEQRALANWFDSLTDEARKAAAREGRIRTAPRAASSEAQAAV